MSWESHRTQVLYAKFTESLKEDYKGYLKSFLEDVEKITGEKVYKVQTNTGSEYNDNTYDTVIEEVFLFNQDGATIDLDLEIPKWFRKKWGDDWVESVYEIVREFFRNDMTELMNMGILDERFKVDTLEVSWQD
jgi:hypothetical protein